MGYDIRYFLIGQLQYDGSIWDPKLIIKLFYKGFFRLSLKHFRIFTQAVIYIHWRSDAIHTLQVFLRLSNSVCLFSFGELNNDCFWPFGSHWQSSMLEESILTSSFFNNWRAVSSNSEFSIYSGRPLSSKLSHLEYWQLLQHCRSNETICTLSFEFLLTAFSHNFAWGQIFLYLCLSRLNQTCSGTPELNQPHR